MKILIMLLLPLFSFSQSEIRIAVLDTIRLADIPLSSFYETDTTKVVLLVSKKLPDSTDLLPVFTMNGYLIETRFPQFNISVDHLGRRIRNPSSDQRIVDLYFKKLDDYVSWLVK